MKLARKYDSETRARAVRAVPRTPVTTLTLYLHHGEVDAIDGLARRTGHPRSGLVAAALARHLEAIS